MCGTVGWEVWFKKWWPVTTFPAFTQRIFVVGIICLIWIQITNSYVKWHWTIYRKMSFNWRCWLESAFDAAEQFKLRIFYQLWGYLSSFKLKKMKKQQKINSKGNWYLLFFCFFIRILIETLDSESHCLQPWLNHSPKRTFLMSLHRLVLCLLLLCWFDSRITERQLAWLSWNLVKGCRIYMYIIDIEITFP